MPNSRIIIAIVGMIVASGTIYYVFFLPQQKIIDADKQSTDQYNEAMNSYDKCEAEMQPKRDAYIRQQCSTYSDTFKYHDCAISAMKSAGFNQLICQRPF